MRFAIFNMYLLLTFFAGTAAAFNPKTTCPRLPKDPIKAQIMAGELFAKAEKDYAESRPIAALKGFLCSHHIIQHENTLFNIAQIAKVSDLKDQAVQILKDYVRHVHGRNKIDPINDIISELDGEHADKNSEEGPIAPLDTGETALAQSDPDSEDASAPKKRRKKVLKMTAVALAASGGAALISGGILQGLAAGAQGRAEQTDEYSVFQEEKQTMERRQVGAIAGFVAGGVLLGSGLAILVVTRSNESASLPASVTLTAAPDYIAITGRF